MRKWWTTLGLMAATLGICTGSASAQYPPPGGGMMGPPPGGGMMGPPPGGGMMGPPPGGGMMGPPPGAFGGPPGAFGGGPPTGGMMGYPPPGAFGGGASPAGMPADFPNPAQPSQEPVSPFAVKDEGMPNAFTDLNTPPRRTDPYALTFRGEYIGWRVSNGPINVPLVTTTSSPTLASFGQLGNANTSILVNSGNNIDYGFNSGFRFTTGVAIGYLPPIEFSGFYTHTTATVFSGGSLTNPSQFLAIPFQDVQPAFLIPGGNGVGTESAAVISVPVGSAVGALPGTISITSEMTFWGAEANVFMALTDPTASCQISLIGGYRHLQLNENLNIGTQVANTGIQFNGLVEPASIFSSSTLDTFATTNAFDGGQFGFRGVLNMGQWSIFGDVKLGMGETAESLSINGSSTLNQTTAGRTPVAQGVAGGILALPTNSVNLSAREFTIVPEVNLSLSFQFTPAVRAFFGYDFLYWSRVGRPGDAISGTIDSRQIPTSANFTQGVSYNGPFAPSSILQRSFIAQGISIGIEIGF